MRTSRVAMACIIAYIFLIKAESVKAIQEKISNLTYNNSNERQRF
jgi:hypothetical protein